MDIKKIAEDKNLKLTTARKALLEIFSKATRPLSYEDVKENISMDKATFYRNMSKFEEEGLINSFESNDKKRYFEISKNCHSHFICTVCNKVECIKETPDFSLEGYEIQNIIIKGICSKCLKKKENNA